MYGLDPKCNGLELTNRAATSCSKLRTEGLQLSSASGAFSSRSYLRWITKIKKKTGIQITYRDSTNLLVKRTGLYFWISCFVWFNSLFKVFQSKVLFGNEMQTGHWFATVVDVCADSLPRKENVSKFEIVSFKKLT